MIEAIRHGAAKALLLAAGAAAPAHMRPLVVHAFKAMMGMVEEIAAGRDGGVMITPWHVSEDGSILAHVQAAACWEAARDMRAEHELRARRPAAAPANEFSLGAFRVYEAQRAALEAAEFWIEAEAASGGTVAADILQTIRAALGKPPG